MIDPEQNPKDSGEWQDWKDHKLDGKTSAFTYNPDPPDVGQKSFPEPSDVNAPEKM